MTDEVNAGYGGKMLGSLGSEVFEGFGLKHGLENFKNSPEGSTVGGFSTHGSFSKI